MAITLGIVRAVLKAEEYDRRFEKFCNEIVSGIEGNIPILNTSASWDLGKDGRSLQAHGKIFCCCSLTDDVDSKAAKDLQRLQRFEPKIERIYFCSSSNLSEKRVAAIKSELQKLLPSATNLEVLGLEQLSDLAARWPEKIERHYPAEISDCIRVLTSGNDDDDNRGLLLALSTVGYQNSLDIRNALYESTLLTCFRMEPNAASEKLRRMSVGRFICADPCRRKR